MASIAMMFGGAIINAAAFIGGNYLAKYLSGDSGRWQKKRGMTKHSRLMRPLKPAMPTTAQSFLTRLKPTVRTKSWRSRTSRTRITPSSSTTRRIPSRK